MTTFTPEDLISDHLELVSLPEIVIRINEMVNDPNCSAADIGETIMQDAPLSARLLKIVNSPFYNFPSKVDTISMAITIVGTRQLRDLVLATAVINKFNAIPEQLVNAQVFWYHNLATAAAARTIASRLRITNTERFFIAGLLHDIGKLVMYLTQPELSRQVLELLKNPVNDVTKLEHAAFGFDHATLGAALLRHWKLPESLIEPTAFHHEPTQAKQYIKETAIIHLANAIANSIETVVSADDDTPIDLSVWETLDIEDTELDEIINDTHAALQYAKQIIYYEQAA